MVNQLLLTDNGAVKVNIGAFINKFWGPKFLLDPDEFVEVPVTKWLSVWNHPLIEIRGLVPNTCSTCNSDNKFIKEQPSLM